MLIGLTGDKRSGKDSTAEILGRLYGHKRYALADKMREGLEALDPWLVTNAGTPLAVLPLSQVLGIYGGWEGAKESEYGAEIRRVQERQGTEAGRMLYGEDHWIDTLINVIEDDYSKAWPWVDHDIAITDVRFPNEAEWVRAEGGRVVELVKPGTTKTGHVSSAGLPRELIDYTINNDGTLADLEIRVKEFWTKYA